MDKTEKAALLLFLAVALIASAGSYNIGKVRGVKAASYDQAMQSSTPATVLAGIGTPAANNMPCNVGTASATSTSVYDQRDIVTGNSIWKCKLQPDNMTYNWVAPFTAGNQLFYGASGLLAGGKCWLGTVTSNTSGQATVNWATAGFTSAPQVQVQPVAAGTAANQMVWANPSSITTTGANITVATPATVSVLGALSIQLASAAYTVSVIACGN